MAGQTTRGYPLFDPTGADVGTRGSAYFNAIAGDNDNGFTTMVDKDITKLDETKLTIYAKTTPQWNIDTTTIIRAGEFGIDTSRGVVRMGNGIDIWAGLSDYLPNIPILTGNNPPNSSTVGVIGQLYLHTNPDKQRFWICRNINLPSYSWEAVAYISDLEELQEGELLMLKSIYDTNNNNIVDNSERLGGDPPSAYLVDTLEFYLDPELWVDNRQTLNHTLFTGTKPGSIYINPSASEEQIKAYNKANLTVVEDAVGLLEVEALGVVPTIPIDTCVELRGGVGNIFVVGGGVGETTVNNVGADSTGNITLTAADIPMDKTAETPVSVKEVIDAHKAQSVLSANGVHDLRYYGDSLQVWSGEEWEDVAGGAVKIPVGDCTDISIIASNGTLTISWTDPEDIVADSVVVAAWRETLLIRKLGDYPENAADGTLVVTNSLRNQYTETGFSDTGLVNGTVYYYKLIPISTTNAANLNPANNISGTPVMAVIPDIPSQSGALTYTGGSLAPNWSGYSSGQLSISGTTTAVDAGTYTVSFTPTPGNQWWDGTVTAKTATWKIDKAAGSLSLSPTSMTLNASTPSGAITVSRTGNGTVSAVSSNTNVATVSVSGTIITVNSVGQASGTATITVSVVEGTNYLAPANKTCAVSAVFSMTFGVSINLGNSNPESAVTYTDDAIGMTAGSAAWDSMPIFKDIKPCMFKNGAVQYYLNPNNFAQKADGSAAVINGNDGDVMIEIPKTGYQIITSGTTLTVKITSDPAKSGFKYYAHTRVTEGDREKLYIGAYHGQIASGKLRSISGVVPTASQTIGAFRTAAKANGAGYDQLAFYPLTLLQCLFLIRFKNLNSQSALGRGYVDGNSAAIATGGTNAKGMYFGETTGKQQMKCFGIEDLWGNVRDWIDGLWPDASRNMWTAFQNFNDTGSGYTNRGQGATANIGNYMSKPQGTSETGFIAKEVTGSATTFFSDNARLNASSLPYFGGGWSDADSAGVFYLLVNASASYANATLGARLMFL